jgi:hypothetical protein
MALKAAIAAALSSPRRSSLYAGRCAAVMNSSLEIFASKECLGIEVLLVHTAIPLTNDWKLFA